jgi:hypothetical protein
VAINGRTVHPPGGMRAWRNSVERYQKRKPPNSSTTALWKSYQQNHLVAKQQELVKEIINFAI